LFYFLFTLLGEHYYSRPTLRSPYVVTNPSLAPYTQSVELFYDMLHRPTAQAHCAVGNWTELFSFPLCIWLYGLGQSVL